MPDPISKQGISKQKEALEVAFISTLETITDLPEKQVKSLATKFRDRTASEIQQKKRKSPDITFYPKNQARLEFDIKMGCVTRTPAEILEHYLDRQDIGGSWSIIKREEKGSLLKVTATRGRALPEDGRSVSDSSDSSGSSSSDSSKDVDELKNKLDNLSDDAKKAVKSVLE